MRQSVAGKDVNTEAEECTVLGAVTKQRLMQAQQTGMYILVRAIVNHKLWKLAVVL
jgi:hypothetical protein